MSFVIYIVRYRDNKSLTGDDPYAYGIKNITKARSQCFWALTHKSTSFNKDGDYKARIYQIYNGMEVYMGEVMNTAWNDRYWYPNSGGKYELKSTGVLGKKLR